MPVRLSRNSPQRYLIKIALPAEHSLCWQRCPHARERSPRLKSPRAGSLPSILRDTGGCGDAMTLADIPDDFRQFSLSSARGWMGTYQLVPGLTSGERPVYREGIANKYIYYWPEGPAEGWQVGSNYASNPANRLRALNDDAACPQDVVTWNVRSNAGQYLSPPAYIACTEGGFGLQAAFIAPLGLVWWRRILTMLDVCYNLDAATGCTRFCGDTGPVNISVPLNGTIRWHSDVGISGIGWTICVAPALTPPSTSPSTSPATRSPTRPPATRMPSLPPSRQPTTQRSTRTPAQLPTPRPTGPPTRPPTRPLTRAPTHGGMLEVTNGQAYCQMTSGNCVTDGAGNYGNDERCTIKVLADGMLTAAEFDVQRCGAGTRCNCDRVVIGGAYFCGTTGPSNVRVAANDTFQWRSGERNTERGWSICWEGMMAPTRSPSSPPTGDPNAQPTGSPVSQGPSSSPTAAPSASPTAAPTSSTPTTGPTDAPTSSPVFTAPTGIPSASPTTSDPTTTPTVMPTRAPTASPTDADLGDGSATDSASADDSTSDSSSTLVIVVVALVLCAVAVALAVLWQRKKRKPEATMRVGSQGSTFTNPSFDKDTDVVISPVLGLYAAVDESPQSDQGQFAARPARMNLACSLRRWRWLL